MDALWKNLSTEWKGIAYRRQKRNWKWEWFTITKMLRWNSSERFVTFIVRMETYLSSIFGAVLAGIYAGEWENGRIYVTFRRFRNGGYFTAE